MHIDENEKMGKAKEGSALSQTSPSIVSDEDRGQSLFFYINSDSSNLPFSIDASSGLISTTSTLDYEATSSYDIKIDVKDDGKPALTTTKT